MAFKFINHLDEPDYNTWFFFFGSGLPDIWIHESNLVSEGKNIFIDHTNFENFQDRIINIFYENDKFLISFFSFFNTTKIYTLCGGNIIYNCQGSCVQYRVCTVNSKIMGDSTGCHSYIQIQNNINASNFVIESSFTQCDGGEGTVLDSSKGKILFPSINISHTSCLMSALYKIINSASSSEVNMSNFYNQSVFLGGIIHYSSLNSLKFCNLINSELIDIPDGFPDSDSIDYYGFGRKDGIIYTYSNSIVNVNNCFFQRNKFHCLFWVSNGGKIFVNECHIDEDN